MNLLPFELYTDPPSTLSASAAAAAAGGRLPLPPSPPPEHAASDMPIYVRQRRGNSALYSAQWHLANGTKWETILVGWTGVVTNYETDDFHLKDSERARAEELLVEKGTEMQAPQMVPVWLHGGHQTRWQAYAEQMLWPLLHYILGEPTDGREEKKWWQDYVRFNEAFADKICEIYQPGDLVWIHDYHLLLVPQILRQRLPKVYIGTFMHAPFPSSEYFRYLSKRAELLEGMLGSNMIAFQSYSYSRHFISSCTRVLGFESTPASVDAFGARVSIEVFPIGIDTDRVERDMSAPGVEENVKALRELYPGKKIIVGRDRLDSVRGVIQKLRAFEIFCQMYPDMVEKVVLIQVTSPAFSSAAKVEKKVSELIAHINGTYGSLHFAPIQHYPQLIARDEYLALLRVADLALITSIRDGMNTTSLEYVVCQKNSHGPVILSEFTGTATSLSDAILVNPWDSVGVAEAIHSCLTMPAPQKAELERKLYKQVTSSTTQTWVAGFIGRLLLNLTSYDHSHVTPVLDRALMTAKYHEAKRRLFMFDYDGTLTPIVREPSAAIPTDRVIRTLKKLAANPKNEVWIISGRDQKFLEQWMGDIEQLGLSAEHGSFLRPVGSNQWTNLTEQMDMSWQNDVMEIFNYYTERTQGSFVERKRCALTWHYRRADPEYGAFQARECQNHLENTVTTKYDVEVMAGKANLEVRPRFVNKGEICKRLVEEYKVKTTGEPAVPDFALCIGDDSTDEDMFRALRKLDQLDQSNVFTVTVGPSSKMTTAEWHLSTSFDVVRSVGVLVGTVDPNEIPGSNAVEEEGAN
ncbi:glycosyltransferase family 20-domain-containing protein [Dipodascopsis tothii]|uniref:glycosyltransferase family 20-domain-containing protein n=1 Tax=Dipodascopsis tothii TaxID=44089 RepID=UPI0034CF99E7